MCTTKVTTFLKSPLVTWIKTFQKESCDDQVDCCKLFNGIFLHSVWQQIETNGSFHSHTTIDENGDSIVSRIRNLSSLLYKIQTFYSDSLGQILVLKLPDVVNISRDPDDECNLEDLETLLLLLLGSAVQCESKERFIEAITALDLSVQHSIVECIRQITDNPSSVWSNNDWGELSLIPDVDQTRMYSTLVSNVNRLAKERDDLSQRVVELVLEIENLKTKGPCSVASLSHSHHHHNRHHSSHHSHHHTPSSLPPSPSSTTGSATLLASSPPPVSADGLIATTNPSLYNSYSSSSVSSLLTINNNESRSHLVVELAEAKSKYRKVVAELEEKSELVNELKENLEQSKETCNKLRSENLELIQEARSAKAYRDEIDVLNERVRKVDRLENEVQRYKDKINELIFYKSRVEEMREDNRILSETKTMLEEQLECSRKRSEQIPELEAQLLQLRAYSNELQFQRDLDRDKIESLMEEIASLQVEKKSVFEELAQVQKELNNLRCQYTAIEPVVSPIGLESNLFEQLNNDAAKRVLKLELENQKLHSLVENIRNKDSTTTGTLMNSGNSKNHNQYQTSSLDSFSSSSASEKGDSTTLPSQLLLDDGLNYSSPVSGNDSGCVSLVGELNSRLERMEKENLRLKGTIEQLRECEARIMELESSKTGQEKELSTVRDNLQKEIYKTETLERSLSNLTTENSRLTRQVEHLSKRLEDCSQEIQALEGENSKLQGTASTLRNTVKRLNDLEREVTHLEAENHRLEQERKSNEKEITRLKQALEAKDSLIDEQANKVSSLELEKKQLSKELDSINANAMNARELEKEKQELVGDLAVCKKSLTALRQDLVDEKIKSQSLTSEMERIHYAMSQMSLKSSSSSSSLTPSLSSNDISQSFNLPAFSSVNIGKMDWSNVFENLLENMIRRKLETKEARITILENNLKEVESRKTKLKDELSAMKEKISKSQIVSDNKSLESSLDVMIEEMEKRLKAAEEENKLLRGDNLSLNESKEQLKEQVKSLQEKVECMSRESNDLHSGTAKAQVENSLLLAQRTSLSSQTAHLQAEIRLLEECRDSIEEKYKELEESYQSLISDHQSLQSLHQQLVADYESLLENHNSLKSSYKSLKSEHKETKEKLEVWLLSNEELKRMLKDGNDCGKCKKMTEENSKCTDEKKQLLEDYRRIETEFKMLQNIYKQLRKENNELKLRHTELEGETAECRQSMSALQVEVSKLSNYCESLGSSSNLLEEQRRTLIGNVINLLSQYHILISEMASRETDNNLLSKDRIAELITKKERLERMIRDYDTMSERERKKVGLRSGETNGTRNSLSRHSLNGSLNNECDDNRLGNSMIASSSNHHGIIDENNSSSTFFRVISSSKQQIASPTSTSGIISNNNSSLTSPISELTSPLSSSSSSTLTKSNTPTTTSSSHNNIITTPTTYYDKSWQPLSTVNAGAITTSSSSTPSNLLVKKPSTPTSLMSTSSLVQTTSTATSTTPLSMISRSRKENPLGGENTGLNNNNNHPNNNESRRPVGMSNDNNVNDCHPPPRLPPRHNMVTAQVDNRMTINVITSPLGNSRVPLPGDPSSLTPPLPKSATCNFVRSTFRSNSINMGSPLKRGCLKDDHGLVQVSPASQNHTHYGEVISPIGIAPIGVGGIRGSHHHHHVHLHHPHAHLHLAPYSNEPSIHSDEESDLLGATTGDRLLTNRNSGASSSNHHHHHHHHLHHHHLLSGGGGGGDEDQNNHNRQDDSDSTLNDSNSINNSTWYEYGCV